MDYELQLKIKNAPLLNLMRAAGYKTAAELSRASRVSQNNIGKILALKMTEYCPDGETVRAPVQQLADFLLVHPDELVPEAHRHSAIKQNEFSAQMNEHQLRQLSSVAATDPARLLEIMETEERDAFADMLNTAELSDREKTVLTGRLRDKRTLTDVGREINVSVARASQIEAKALRKLRRGAYKNPEKIKEAAGIYAECLGAE